MFLYSRLFLDNIFIPYITAHHIIETGYACYKLALKSSGNILVLCKDISERNRSEKNMVVAVRVISGEKSHRINKWIKLCSPNTYGSNLIKTRTWFCMHLSALGKLMNEHELVTRMAMLLWKSCVPLLFRLHGDMCRLHDWSNTIPLKTIII